MGIVCYGSKSENIGSSLGSVVSSSSSKCDLNRTIINRKTYLTPDVDNRHYKGQTFSYLNMGYGRRYIICNMQGSKKKVAYDTLKDPNKKKCKWPFIRINYETYVRMKVGNDKVWRIYELKKEHTYSICGFENTRAIGIDTKQIKREWNEFIGDRDAVFMIEIKRSIYKTFRLTIALEVMENLLDCFGQMKKQNKTIFHFELLLVLISGIIFIPFTGINNHKRCITFGVELLSSESVKSYTWLLHTLKKTFVKEPNVIVIDQVLTFHYYIQKTISCFLETSSSFFL
uniref:MULE transposase domain-containing protein n=1 Tax=Lactuca sativa TaxID=4236 RepID=A0A9R1UG43_LACSA|nr:hypothetical protein LSAT_V11C900490410 [Lactuca sativa]